MLLLAEWGNYTFSDRGGWGFVEYLLKGRWRQLWLALAALQPNRTGRSLGGFSRTVLLPLPAGRLWRLAQDGHCRRWASRIAGSDAAAVIRNTVDRFGSGAAAQGLRIAA